MEVHKSGIASTTFLETTAVNLHALGSYFYKIIVATSNQSNKLRIPNKYVKTYYEEQLAEDYVKLRVNDGRLWRVKLFKQSGEVWLTNGWESLVKSYSLNYGNFLLFMYHKGDFEFHVTIFDTSCCEIEYDLVFDDHAKAREVIEISSQDDEETMDQDNSNKCVISPEDGVADEETSVMKSPEAFKSENPHFKVVLDYHKIKSLINRLQLCIPIGVAKVHFKHKQDIILKGPADEKSYKLRILMYIRSSSANIYGTGWRKFLGDNNLHMGDGCVFELIDPRSDTYKATIFRNPVR